MGKVPAEANTEGLDTGAALTSRNVPDWKVCVSVSMCVCVYVRVTETETRRRTGSWIV